MKFKCATVALLISLIVSVALNIFFLSSVAEREEASYKQVMTTFTIEMLLKESGTDMSYEYLFRSASEIFGDLVVEGSALEIHVSSGHDERAIQIDDALLLFKDGQYYGSHVHGHGQ